MKRRVETVVLGLLLTLLCLVLGGAGCKEPEPLPVKATCKYVVGSLASEQMGHGVTVQFCKMPDGTCWYVPGKQGGTMVQTRCYDHYFAEVVVTREALR